MVSDLISQRVIDADDFALDCALCLLVTQGQSAPVLAHAPIIPEFNLQGSAGHPVYEAAIGTSLLNSDLTQAPAAKV